MLSFTVSRVIGILIEFLRGELDGMHWLVQTDATLEQTQDGLLEDKHTDPSKHRNEYTVQITCWNTAKQTRKYNKLGQVTGFGPN